MQARFGGGKKGHKAKTEACRDRLMADLQEATAQRITDLETENEDLRRKNDILLEERDFDRQECDERVERCNRALKSGK